MIKLFSKFTIFYKAFKGHTGRWDNRAREAGKTETCMRDREQAKKTRGNLGERRLFRSSTSAHVTWPLRVRVICSPLWLFRKGLLAVYRSLKPCYISDFGCFYLRLYQERRTAMAVAAMDKLDIHTLDTHNSLTPTPTPPLTPTPTPPLTPTPTPCTITKVTRKRRERKSATKRIGIRIRNRSIRIPSIKCITTNRSRLCEF